MMDNLFLRALALELADSSFCLHTLLQAENAITYT